MYKLLYYNQNDLLSLNYLLFLDKTNIPVSLIFVRYISIFLKKLSMILHISVIVFVIIMLQENYVQLNSN